MMCGVYLRLVLMLTFSFSKIHLYAPQMFIIDISMQGSDAETNSARDFHLKLQRKN